MRTSALWAVCLLASTGCLHSHFEHVVGHAALTELACGDRDHAVVELSPWGYRVDGCGEPRFYRCQFAGQASAGTQCCHQVAGAAEAMSVFAAHERTPQTCLDLPIFSK